MECSSGKVSAFVLELSAHPETRYCLLNRGTLANVTAGIYFTYSEDQI